MYQILINNGLVQRGPNRIAAPDDREGIQPIHANVVQDRQEYRFKFGFKEIMFCVLFIVLMVYCWKDMLNKLEWIFDVIAKFLVFINHGYKSVSQELLIPTLLPTKGNIPYNSYLYNISENTILYIEFTYLKDILGTFGKLDARNVKINGQNAHKIGFGLPGKSIDTDETVFIQKGDELFVLYHSKSLDWCWHDIHGAICGMRCDLVSRKNIHYNGVTIDNYCTMDHKFYNYNIRKNNCTGIWKQEQYIVNGLINDANDISYDITIEWLYDDKSMNNKNYKCDARNVYINGESCTILKFVNSHFQNQYNASTTEYVSIKYRGNIVTLFWMFDKKWCFSDDTNGIFCEPQLKWKKGKIMENGNNQLHT